MLSDKHKIFVEEYMIDFNGTRAASRAGFAEAKAAWRLLRREDIRAEVDRRLLERQRASKLTIEKIEGMLRNMAEVEPLDIWDAEGNVLPLVDMPPRARQAIKSIKKVVKESFITGVEETTVVVELWDKKGATELLGRFKKMFTDNVHVDGEQKVSFTINYGAKR
jgi:phage terminase small subunit